MGNRKLKQKYILFCILVIAIFFRLWQLDKIPPGLYHDEAINGNEAIFNPGKVFYPENYGREGLFINLVFSSFSIFEISAWSLRAVSAVIGILTVLGLYLLTKELFSFNTLTFQNSNTSTVIALIGSFFLAVSFWHTNFSRIGFRAILVPFILIFSFYFLFRGFRTQRVWSFLIAGVFFGLGFYTYTVFRMAVILLAAILIPGFLIYKKQNLQKKYIFFVSCFLFLVFVVALPLGFYFLKNPQHFIGRAAETSAFTQQNPPKALGESLILHLGMFNFYGDANWRHNLSTSPQLLWPVGILFLVGLIVSIRDLISFRKRKNWSMINGQWVIICWFFIMLLPAILTAGGLPHALRAIGTIPAVYILASLGFWHIYRKLNQNIRGKNLLVLASIMFLISVGVFQFNKYFIVWGNHPGTKDGFSKDHVEIGNYLNSLPYATQKIVIINRSGVPVPWPAGPPMPAQTVMFIENIKHGKPQSTYLLPEDLDKIIIDKKPTIIVPLNKYDKDLFMELQDVFPEGKIEQRNEILIYEIQSHVR